jgi:hypothetical protein
MSFDFMKPYRDLGYDSQWEIVKLFFNQEKFSGFARGATKQLQRNLVVSIVVTLGKKPGMS